jgi:glycosyltransferase involved in cell wall biosynthesis
MNCLNGEKYLREAIDSVYAQTYENWEIIFWDNVSTDDSAQIAKSYDSKLRYYKANKTTTLGKARMLAIEKSLGDHISFLDCDDIWFSEKLKKQIDVLLCDNDLGFVYCRAEKISNTNKLLGYIPDYLNELPSGFIFKQLVKQNFIPFVSVLVPKDKYYQSGGFPEHFKNSTDYYLFLKLSYKHKVAAINDVCCQYRVHSGNMSNSHLVIGATEDIEAVSSFLPDKYAEEGLLHCHATLALMYLKERNVIVAVTTLLKYGGLTILFNRLGRKLKNLLIRKMNA